MKNDSVENLQRFKQILNKITGAGYEIREGKLFLPKTYTDDPVINRLVGETAYPNVLINAKGEVDSKSLTEETYKFLEQYLVKLGERRQKLAESASLINEITDINFTIEKGLLVGKDPMTRAGAIVYGENKQNLHEFFASSRGDKTEGPAEEHLRQFHEAAVEVTGKAPLVTSVSHVNPTARLIMDKFLALKEAGAIKYNFGDKKNGDKNESVLIITDVDITKLRNPELTKTVRTMVPKIGKIPALPLGK